MSVDLNEMRLKALLILDPESGYTEYDFNQEFGNSFNQSTIYGVDFDDYKIKLSFVNESDNEDPQYATDGSSGFDLRANLNETIKLSPQGGFAIVPTGLFFEIPNGFEIQVRSRSGLASKNQVCVLNSPGTVDSDYIGEVKVILINHGVNEFIVNHGDRIAQAVLATVSAKNVVNLVRVNNISKNTERNSGGFGSTGIN